jgi:hypothetical protein
VGRSHRGARDGIGGSLGAGPGRKNVQTRSKSIDALAPVAEVGTLITDGGSSNGNSLNRKVSLIESTDLEKKRV